MARKTTRKQPTDAERLNSHMFKTWMDECRARALSRLSELGADRDWKPGKNIVKTSSTDPNDIMVDYSAAKDGHLNNKERALLEIAASNFTDSKVSEALGGCALALWELMLAAATIEQLTVRTEIHAFQELKTAESLRNAINGRKGGAAKTDWHDLALAAAIEKRAKHPSTAQDPLAKYLLELMKTGALQPGFKPGDEVKTVTKERLVELIREWERDGKLPKRRVKA